MPNVGTRISDIPAASGLNFDDLFILTQRNNDIYLSKHVTAATLSSVFLETLGYDSINGFFDDPEDQSYTLIQYCPFEGSLNSLIMQSTEASGEGDVDLTVNGVSTGFNIGTYTISGTIEVSGHTLSGDFNIGDKVELTFSNTNDDLLDVGFSLIYTR